jgi:DNA-binding transcriptional MerR regulator
MNLEAANRRTVGVNDAAEYLDVNRRTVQRYCDRGLLSYDQLPSGHRRIHRLSVIALKQRIAEHVEAS